jgi:hypothetical protein
MELILVEAILFLGGKKISKVELECNNTMALLLYQLQENKVLISSSFQLPIMYSILN